MRVSVFFIDNDTEGAIEVRERKNQSAWCVHSPNLDTYDESKSSIVANMVLRNLEKKNSNAQLIFKKSALIEYLFFKLFFFLFQSL